MSERIGSGYCEKLRNCNDNNSSAIESGGFSNFMSQLRRRGNPAVVDEMPGVYAADPNMFSEIFNFQTGVELLGVPKDENVHGLKLGAASPGWRVSNGHQQYVEFNGQNMALNALKEGNMNVQGLQNMDANAMQLYLMNPANNGDYSSQANPPSSNMVASFSSLDNNHGSQINKNSFGAEIPLQIPSFGMGRQGLCVNQMPNRESWQGGGVNELLLLPTANGNMQNNTQFTNPAQMNHNNSSVNWTSRHAGSMQPSTSQWCEDDCKVGDFGFRNRDDGRSVQGLSLSLSSNYQMQVQPFETNRLISSQMASDTKTRSHDVNKLGYFTRSDGVSRGIWNPHGGVSGSTHINIASSSSAVLTGYLKHSKYLKPTLQLLEEFCNVATKGMKSLQTGHAPKKLEEEKAKDKEKESSLGMSYSVRESGRKVGSSVTICGNTSTGTTGICSESGNNQISFAGDRFELRRRKAKLLWMLDEVERRYRHYCDQMKIVITSFESVAGPGAAATYTSLASKAMSRHFRCLKDAITGQIKATNEALGERESNYPGVTKGETPRLKYLEQSLRQQRTFQQVGMLEQDAWRPQRGLPERAVTVLRAWLFEHFLHPYPSDADKHLLARQTGLSRSQVSNWFINARVRLWKPMVEDMYQEEFKEAEKEANKPNNLSSHDNAGLKNEARGSDSNKSCEELKQDLASLTTVPESSGAISLPLESQDEIFDSTIMSSFLRNTNTSCNPNSRKGELMENVESQGNKVQGSSQAGGSGEFSSYISNNNNNGMFTKYFGSGDVSLTLGLRHSGALSVPVADQEKYHNALYNLP